MILTYKLKIFGKVQGVWYRKWFLQEANKIGIKGYIKNSKNIDIVNAIIQGNLIKIDKIITKSYIGPRQSKVLKIDKFLLKKRKIYEDFSIR
tara:strand:+ start:886 stop:1161 length:276 start_codon:yes stop_codon:yes gene_type:complete